MTQSEHPHPIPDQVLTPLSAEALNDAVVAASSVIGRMFSETRFAGVQGGGMAALTTYREAVEAAIRAPLEAKLAALVTVTTQYLKDYDLVMSMLGGEDEEGGVSPTAALRAALAGVPKEAGDPADLEAASDWPEYDRVATDFEIEQQFHSEAMRGGPPTRHHHVSHVDFLNHLDALVSRALGVVVAPVEDAK